jgi:hypothetical protein
VESALTGGGDRLKQTAFELTGKVGERSVAGALPRVAADPVVDPREALQVYSWLATPQEFSP